MLLPLQLIPAGPSINTLKRTVLLVHNELCDSFVGPTDNQLERIHLLDRNCGTMRREPLLAGINNKHGNNVQANQGKNKQQWLFVNQQLHQQINNASAFSTDGNNNDDSNSNGIDDDDDDDDDSGSGRNGTLCSNTLRNSGTNSAIQRSSDIIDY